MFFYLTRWVWYSVWDDLDEEIGCLHVLDFLNQYNQVKLFKSSVDFYMMLDHEIGIVWATVLYETTASEFWAREKDLFL